MTREEIIQGLQFTIDMFLLDPTTGETFTEPRNDMDKTTIDSCREAIKLLNQEPCEDAVSRSSLLNKLDDCYKEKIKVAPDNMAEDFMQVEKLIKQEPPVTPTQKWIPVSERLPQKSGDYLVWLEPYQEKPFISIEEIDCDGIIKEWNHIHPWEIKAWMPSPKPYKEVKR